MHVQGSPGFVETMRMALRCRREIHFRERQLPHSLSGCLKKRITQCWREWRNARLAYSCRWRIALEHVHVYLVGSIAHASDLIVVEVRLLDDSILGRNLAITRQAGAEHRRALELQSCLFGIHHQSGIYNRVNSRNSNRALIVDFDLDDRRHVCEEAPVRRDA
jgi:hypothetical protein